MWCMIYFLSKQAKLSPQHDRWWQDWWEATIFMFPRALPRRALRYCKDSSSRPCRRTRASLLFVRSCCISIQHRIDEALEAMDTKDINERRRGDLDKFLATTNTKMAVFRDIIIESGSYRGVKGALKLGAVDWPAPVGCHRLVAFFEAPPGGKYVSALWMQQNSHCAISSYLVAPKIELWQAQ